MKDNLNDVNIKKNMLVEKDNLSYNINKRFKEKELTSVTTYNEGDKCYLFTYSDDTSDKLVYSNNDKYITFNDYTFNIIDGITVEEPTITEHYDAMSSTTYNGYFIINITITLNDKDYSIKVVKHFDVNSLVIDLTEYMYDNERNKYTHVEYLESTGTQYINTEYYVKSTMMLDFNMSLKSTSGDQKFIGSYGNHNCFVLGVLSGLWRIGSGISDDWAIQDTNATLTMDKTHLIIKNNYFTFNDHKYNENSKISNQDAYPLVLFSVAYKGSILTRGSIIIYDFKIYDNDTLVRDYKPVLDSSERPCLFDKVEKKRYYNQGSGEFLYG